MTRNDQKFLAPFLKNSEVENLFSELLSELKSPPEKNTFIRKPVRRTRKNPVVKYEIKPPIVANRSDMISRSKPSASCSAAMLLPNPCCRTLLTGDAIRVISSSVKNQMIKTPLHDFKDLQVPDFKALITFIINEIIMK
jgi:hypothetical protein